MRADRSPQAPAATRWTRAELERLARWNEPARVQEFLDAIPYSADHFYRCPRRVLRDRKAHCFDGAVFAAAMLRRLGQTATILDMRAVNDDDHVVAIFRRGGCLGAVAKSNFVGLRFREPVFRSTRELVLSYFEDFYNVAREKTLRAYSVPLDLGRFDDLGWETNDGAMEVIAARLDASRHIRLLTRAQVAALRPVDERRYAAGLLGSNPAGLFQPRR